MKYISVALVSLASQVAAADGDTIEKLDFGGRALSAVWADRNCHGLRLDHDRFAAVASAYGVSLSDFEPPRAALEGAQTSADALERKHRVDGADELCADMPSRFDGGSFDRVVTTGERDATLRPARMVRALEAVLDRAEADAARTVVLEVSLAAEKCPGIAMDLTDLVTFASAFGLDYSDPAEAEQARSRVPTIIYEIQNVGLDGWCDKIETRFGPTGIVAPGLID